MRVIELLTPVEDIESIGEGIVVVAPIWGDDIYHWRVAITNECADCDTREDAGHNVEAFQRREAQ